MSETVVGAIDQAAQWLEEARRRSAQVEPGSPEAPAEKVRTWAVRFDADHELYTALLLAAKRKRVSIKYLMLELVKEAGYPVDLDKAAEDGRRNR